MESNSLFSPSSTIPLAPTIPNPGHSTARRGSSSSYPLLGSPLTANGKAWQQLEARRGLHGDTCPRMAASWLPHESQCRARRGKMTPLASQRPGLVKVQEVSSIGLVLKESWCWSSEGWSCTAYCSQLLVRTAEQLASPTQLGLLAGMVWSSLA